MSSILSAARWLTLVCALLLSAAAQAEVAQVLEVRGVAMLERTGQTPRLLGAGERLDARDTIHTAHDSWAVLEFTDQTRITLRPQTVFRIESWRDGKAESALVGLVKGGFRAITGWIGKRNPQAVAFRTPAATIGIRGTEFVARLCEADCESEARVAPPVSRPAAGRFGAITGGVSALRPDGRWRGISLGEPVYVDDAIVTGSTGATVLFFPDGTRVALEPGAILIVDKYEWDGSFGEANLLLIDGTADLTTGRISQRDPERLRFFTPDGAVKFHGTRARVSTEARLQQSGPPPGGITPAMAEGTKQSGQTTVSVYSGQVALRSGGEAALIPAGQRGMADSAGVALAGSAEPDAGLRSSGLTAAPALFGSGATGAPGLYVAVIEGKVTLGEGSDGTVLGPGEAAHIGRGGGAAQRLNGLPGFLVADMFVAPSGSGALSCTPFATAPASARTGPASRNLRFDAANLRIGVDKAALPANTGLNKGDPTVPGGKGLGPTDPSGGPGQTLGVTGEIRPAVSLTTRVRSGFMGSNMDQGAITSNKWSQSGGGPGFRGPTGGQVSSGVGDALASLISDMLTEAGGDPTGDPKADAAELEYAQQVGPAGYTATKNLTPVQRGNYWNAMKMIQQTGSGTRRPRDDVDQGGGGPPVVMRRSDGGLNATAIRRQVADALGQAGGAGDGRTDQQGTAGGGAMAMQQGEKLGVPQGDGGTGTVNINAVMRLDPLVNFQ